jgi:hypothetical protein
MSSKLKANEVKKESKDVTYFVGSSTKGNFQHQ